MNLLVICTNFYIYYQICIMGNYLASITAPYIYISAFGVQFLLTSSCVAVEQSCVSKAAFRFCSALKVIRLTNHKGILRIMKSYNSRI